MTTPSATGPAPRGTADPSPAPRGVELADEVAAAVLSVDGVVGLHGGMFGEAATYLPGRRVTGVRLGENATEVRLTLASATWDLPKKTDEHYAIASLGRVWRPVVAPGG